MGSGTTAISALLNNRQYIGIEISPEYIELAESRINEYFKDSFTFEQKEAVYAIV
jgi:DNA modification methylase